MNQVLSILCEIKSLIEKDISLRKDHFNFKEACLYLGVSNSYLYKLTSANEITYFCPTGKLIYFKRSDLESWLTKNRIETREEIGNDTKIVFPRRNNARNKFK